MRIRPWVATAAVTVVAAAALGTVVASNDPATASAAVKFLFWATLALTSWGVLATVILVLRGNLAQATWCGLLLAVGLLVVAGVVHNGHDGRQLLGGIVFATLSLVFVVGYRLRGRT